MEDMHLEHYGVLGMHWGIRRYQPYAKNYTGNGEFIGKSNKAIARKINKATQNATIKTQIHNSIKNRVNKKYNKYNQKIDKKVAVSNKKIRSSKFNEDTGSYDTEVSSKELKKVDAYRTKLQNKLSKSVNNLQRSEDVINRDKKYIDDALNELGSRGANIRIKQASLYYTPVLLDRIHPIVGNTLGLGYLMNYPKVKVKN